jgi:hypothetical protein
MAKFKKAMLKVGEKMHSANGVVLTTPERLKHFADQHKKLRESGYRVPSRWEHADDPADMIPLATDDFQKKLDGRHAVGEMVGFDLAADGQSAELTFEITDQRAIEQVDSNRVTVSPIIANAWRDGRGNQYSDFLSHADLVERPVDFTQGPFTKVEETIALSLEKYVDLEAVKMAFDAQSDGEEAMSDTLDTTPAEPAKNPDAPPKATDKSKVTAVLDGLKIKGVVLPSDFDFSGDSAIDILLAAINSSVAADVKKEESEPDDKEDDPPVVASPGYAQMSTEQKGNAAFALLERKHREQLGRDLTSLLESGRCTPAEANDRKAALGTIKLALDNDGNEIPGDIEKFIASRQPVPKGTFWTDEQRTKLRLSAEAAEPPINLGGERSPEEVKSLADAQLKTAGYRK